MRRVLIALTLTLVPAVTVSACSCPRDPKHPIEGSCHRFPPPQYPKS